MPSAFWLSRWKSPIVNVVPAFKKHGAKGKCLGCLPGIHFSWSHGMDEVTDREKSVHSGGGRRACEDEEG